VIPVKPQLAPKGFRENVFKPGRGWLKKNGLPLSGAIPPGTELKPYWRWCLSALHDRYGGVCAYLCIYIEKALRAHSVDHFVPKSKKIEHAYRWSNYRLACPSMNSRKQSFEDVLDPFELDDETFHINFLDGSIAPNPALPKVARETAQDTIDRLGLDEEDCRKMRRETYDDYRQRSDPADFLLYLAKKSPFVASEIRRQKL